MMISLLLVHKNLIVMKTLVLILAKMHALTLLGLCTSNKL